MTKFLSSMFVSAALMLALCLPGVSAHAADGAFTEAQKKEIEAMIDAQIKKSGKEIMDAVRVYQEEEAKLEDAKAEAKIKELMAVLTDTSLPSVGNPQADVTIVEFFDYNCGYCKKVVPELQKLVQEDKNLRVVFKEMPILGPTSKTAAEWALAAHKQGKYFEYHMAVMDSKGAKNEETLSQLAKDLGLDVEKMKTDAASKEVKDIISQSMKTAESIGIQGTPAFIVNGKLQRGYLGEGGLKAVVAEARKGKS